MEKRWNLPERRMIVKKGSAWWLGGGEEKREEGRGREAKEEGVLAWRLFLYSNFLLACRPGLLAPEPRQWGPLHGRPPAPSACQGHAPEPQSRLTHPCERWHVPLFYRLLPRAHGVCRLPKAPPPALSFGEGANWLRCALPVDLPPLDSEADGGLSLFGLLFLVFE